MGIRSMVWAAVLAVAGFGALPVCAHAQFPQAPPVPKSMMDSPVLKPPPGHDVAIVEFGDLECPACRAANPILMSAVSKYHVPWVRHDFLIPGHVWSAQAAVNARWFDTKGTQLGDQYRDYIFEQQPNIATLGDLEQYTQTFAKQHNVAFPFMVDPQGKLRGEIDHDKDLGRELGINQTPTIYVVTRNSHDPGYPIVRVTDPQMLFTYLDQAISATSPAGGGHVTRARK